MGRREDFGTVDGFDQWVYFKQGSDRGVKNRCQLFNIDRNQIIPTCSQQIRIRSCCIESDAEHDADILTLGATFGEDAADLGVSSIGSEPDVIGPLQSQP